MLETGKFAFDTVNSASVQILEKIEAWGYTSYRVFNPATGTVYKVTAYAHQDPRRGRTVAALAEHVPPGISQGTLRSRVQSNLRLWGQCHHNLLFRNMQPRGVTVYLSLPRAAFMIGGSGERQSLP